MRGKWAAGRNDKWVRDRVGGNSWFGESPQNFKKKDAEFPLRFLYCATLVLNLEWRLSYTDLSQGSLDEKGLGLYPGTIQCWKGTWQIQHSPENSLQVRILRESFIILIITIPLPHIYSYSSPPSPLRIWYVIKHQISHCIFHGLQTNCI